MTAPLTDEALLRARGWTEVAPGMWLHPDPRRAAGQTPRTAAHANELRILGDSVQLSAHGSVTYRATAEQTKSPILAACNGTTLERDVIAKLAERIDALETELCRALEKQAPAAIVLSPKSWIPLIPSVARDRGYCWEGMPSQLQAEIAALYPDWQPQELAAARWERRP